MPSDATAASPSPRLVDPASARVRGWVPVRHDPTPGRRFHEVDLLRLVAAVAVVGYHFLFRASTGDRPLAHTGFTDLATPFRYGYLGVDLFFVISGFVILRSAWGRSPSAFLASRIGRLYPAFWVACTVTAVVVTVVPFDRFQVTPLQWLANLTMASEAFGVTYVDGVYWTLAVELAFYLLVVGLCLVGITTGRVLGFAAVWLGVSVVHAFWPLSSGWNLLFVPEWTPYFVAGILLALVAKDGWRRRYALMLATAIGWSLYRALDFAAVLTDKYAVTFSPLVVGGIVLTIYAAMGLIASGWTLPRVARIAWVGGLTYPLYLLHENIGFVLFEAGNTLLGLNRWVVLGTTLAVVTALAWWLHVAVENRFARPLNRAVYLTWVRTKLAAAVVSPTWSVSGSVVDRATRHGYTPAGQVVNR